ncbi:HNH endonuclease [Kluyvera sp. SCKS090646]|uniref:HNH endonuclease n=1 Tax=Kluyvera sichuanensis TaxID=2725494 RepID=A0ABR6RYR1_9ENTR|nr:HNH endonuclease signature motif containing protein [Kluyvera sichuanensis]MBC1188195.1 HNH endonuclease [Kluyvera sichuanensis]
MGKWTEEDIQAVWEKADTASNNDKDKWRKDQCGAWISRDKYGDRNSVYGWEIDHIKTVSNNGTDELSNLRPLQWENNAARGDGRLVTTVTAKGVNNIRVSDTDKAV